MKLKDGFILTEVEDDFIAVPIGKTADELHGIIRLNKSGKVIWDALAAGLNTEAAAERLTELYHVDQQTALKDVLAVEEQLKTAGLMED